MIKCSEYCNDCIYHNDCDIECNFTYCVKETEDEFSGMGRG